LPFGQIPAILDTTVDTKALKLLKVTESKGS